MSRRGDHLSEDQEFQRHRHWLEDLYEEPKVLIPPVLVHDGCMRDTKKPNQMANPKIKGSGLVFPGFFAGSTLASASVKCGKALHCKIK